MGPPCSSSERPAPNREVPMNIERIRRPVAEIAADSLALALFADPLEAPADVAGTALGEVLGRLIAAKDVGAAVGDTTPLLGLGEGLSAAGSVYVFGLGPRGRLDAAASFSAGVALAKRLAAKPRETVALVLPTAALTAPLASALVEGLVVGTQGPDLRKS